MSSTEGKRRVASLAGDLVIEDVNEFITVLQAAEVPFNGQPGSYVDEKKARKAWKDHLQQQEAERAEAERQAEEARRAAAAPPPPAPAVGQIEAVLMAQKLSRRPDVFLTINTPMIGEALGFPGLRDSDLIADDEVGVLKELAIRNRLVLGEVPEPQPGAGLRVIENLDEKLPDTTVGELAIELDTSTEDIADLAELGWTWTVDTKVNGEEVRQLFHSRKPRLVEEPASTSRAVVPRDARASMVAAPRGDNSLTREDKELITRLLRAIELILTVYPYRPPVESIRPVKEHGVIVGYNVPTLPDPTHFTWLDAMQYHAIRNDPEASFTPLNERQLQLLAHGMEQLSIVPKTCVNCLDRQGFGLGMTGKVLNLLNGHRSQDGNVFTRFYLPGRRREFEELYQSLGLPFDRFKVLEFRQVHLECGIIAAPIQGLVSSPAFAGADWYDPAVRKRFLEEIVPIVIRKIPEISEKTQGRVGRAIVVRRLGLIVKVEFDKLDAFLASQRAGQALRGRIMS